MGLFWTSASSDRPASSSEAQWNQAEPQAPSQSQSSPPSSSTKPPSRDELAESELESILAEISADSHPSSAKYSHVPKDGPPKTDPNSSEPQSQQVLITKRSAAAASFTDSLLPTTMSCRAAFDQAFYCQSFGGKFNDIYRYGAIQSCSEDWSKFWFCMKTRTFSDKPKEEAIRGWYRKREGKRYENESSENVWRSREKKLEWGEAFNKELLEYDKETRTKE